MAIQFLNDAKFQRLDKLMFHSTGEITTTGASGTNFDISAIGSNTDLRFLADNDDGSSSVYFLLDASMADYANPDYYTRFPDNSHLVFGNSANITALDFEIYHEGTTAYLQGDSSIYMASENLIQLVATNGIDLYHNSSKKFETTTTGVDVTGTVNLDNLTINGGQGSDGQVLTSTGSGIAWENAASGSGTVTSVNLTAGNLIDVSGGPITTSGSITVDVDLSELTDMTGGIDASVDEIVLLDNGAQRRKRFAEIFGSNAYNSTTIPTNNNQLTNGAGYITSFTNYYLDDITKSGNTLTFSVNGTDDQTYTFGSNAFTSTTIPTNNNQLTNGAGYITDGNSGWNNTYGFITASSSDTLTNKGGNISQWTNDSGYITSSSLPTVNNGTLTLSTSAGLDGSASFTANQSGNSTFTVSLDLSELTDMTGAVDTAVDEIILLDNGAERRKRFAEIFGSNAYNSTTIPTNNNQLTNGAGYITSASLPTVNNGTLTVQGTGALGGSGTFTANQSGNTTISISHDDTSSQGSVNNSGNTVIQDVTLDGYGHVTGLESKTLSIPTVNNATLTVQGTGALGGSGTFTANQSTNATISISHDDTSSQGSVNNSGNTVIQDVTLDTYGHVTGLESKTLSIPTNNNQLTNGAGYITGESDTLSTVVARGASTSSAITTGDITIQGASNSDAVLILKDGNTSGYINSEIQFRPSNSNSFGAKIEYLSNPGASEMRIYTEGSSTNSARFKTQATYFTNQVHATQFVGQTYVITGSVDHTYQNSYAYWYYNWHQSTSFSSSRFAENSFVAPFDGYIGRFYHRGVGLDSSSATSLTVIAEINGSYNSMGSGTLSGSGSNKIFEWENTSSVNLTFNEGDRIEMKWNINALFGESCYAVELVRKET